MGKLAKVFQGCCVVGTCGFFGREKIAKEHPCSIDADYSAPSESSPILPNSLERTRARFLFALIARLAKAISNSQVLICIVQRILINVIAFAFVSFLKAEKETMKIHARFLACGVFGRRRVKSIGQWHPHGVPLELHDAIRFMWTDPRNLSLRQWNFDVVWKGHPHTPNVGHFGGLFQQSMPLSYLNQGGL